MPIVEATQSDAHNASTSYRRQLLDRSAASYLNAEERPFIHLVDGGLADNLGVRILLDRVVASGSIKNRFRESPPGSVRKIVLIVVNSERDMVDRIDQSDKVPSTAQVIDALVFGAGSRSTQETMAALNDGVSGWADKIAQSRGERNSPFSADAEIHVIPVSLHDVDSPDFGGGRVEIFYTRFGSAEDQLGVRDEGTGVGQIGVSGGTVSFNDGSGAVTLTAWGSRYSCVCCASQVRVCCPTLQCQCLYCNG